MELLGETLLTTEQQTLLSTARTCGEQLFVVINDILDFARIQENKVVLEDNMFSLHLLLVRFIIETYLAVFETQ